MFLNQAEPVYVNVQSNPVSWKINTNHLKWMRKLGEGHFGEVWHASTKKGIKGQLKGKDLAVKKLKGKDIRIQCKNTIENYD